MGTNPGVMYGPSFTGTTQDSTLTTHRSEYITFSGATSFNSTTFLFNPFQPFATSVNQHMLGVPAVTCSSNCGTAYLLVDNAEVNGRNYYGSDLNYQPEFTAISVIGYAIQGCSAGRLYKGTGSTGPIATKSTGGFPTSQYEASAADISQIAPVSGNCPVACAGSQRFAFPHYEDAGRNPIIHAAGA